MPESIEFSVVVPVRDEAGNAAALAREIAAVLDGRSYEMIFVDDASRDDTRGELAALKGQLPTLRLIGHRRNSGQSRAVRTGVLATNLGVHVKIGRENALVWVTTLDRGQPVAGAEVTVNDCRGQPLWKGTSDANGLARIEQALVEQGECPADSGFFVTARHTDAKGVADMAFVFSSWQKGIEPWRFGVPASKSLRYFEKYFRTPSGIILTSLAARAFMTPNMNSYISRPPGSIFQFTASSNPYWIRERLLPVDSRSFSCSI